MVWKEISGYEGLYEVSDTGLVRSLNFNHTGKTRIISPGKQRDGYLAVQLCKDGIRKNLLVHRLVANAFIQNPQNLKTVNHIDEDKTNNNVSNLEWMSHGDNARYSHNKPVVQLDKNGNVVVFPSIIEAERQTGIHQGNICSCCRGKLKSAGGYIWRYA